MTDVMANLIIDVHQFKAELTFVLDSNCLLIASTVSEHSLRQILLSVLMGSSTNWALYN
jgi:hypothetical protein